MENKPFFIIFFCILISSFVAATTATNSTQQAFIQCFNSKIQPCSSRQLLHTPDSSSYAAVLLSSVQNLRFLAARGTGKPVLIVVPTEPFHAQTTVLCAKAAGLRIRVRSGGHDYEGLSYISHTKLSKAFLVVDIANLNNVTINAAESTAWVGAAATTGEVYYHIGSYNNTEAFPAGICPTIGVGGHFSGGAIGALMRKYCLGADNIVDATLVNAAGELLNRSTMGEDLFWAIRGGGGASFGIILSFKINLVYVPPKVTVFTISRTIEQNATKLMYKWQSIAPKCDPNLFVRVIIFAKDDKKAKPNRTIVAKFNSLFLGPSCELLPLLETSFPELGAQPGDLQEMTWLESVLYFAGHTNESASILLSRKPEHSNSSFKAKSDFVEEAIGEEAWEAIWGFLLKAIGERVVLIMDPWGGRLDEIEEEAIAFPHRKGNLFNIQYFMSWLERGPRVSEGHLEWMKKLYEFMGPYVSKNPRAAYLNYKDLDLGWNEEGREVAEWGMKYFKGNYERLRLVKKTVDPENFFWSEQSILPA